ncbi:MAG: hypothetical protein EA377_11255, partial [Phycisphaerales bacterium]
MAIRINQKPTPTESSWQTNCAESCLAASQQRDSARDAARYAAFACFISLACTAPPAAIIMYTGNDHGPFNPFRV